MNKRAWFRAGASLAAVAICGIKTAGQASAAVLQMTADLSGSDPLPKGMASFRDDSMKRWLDVSVLQGPAKGAGMVLDVLMDGGVIGRIALNDDAKGKFHFRSNEGDDIPAVKEGSKLQILTQGGTVLLAGTFAGTAMLDDDALDEDDDEDGDGEDGDD